MAVIKFTSEKLENVRGRSIKKVDNGYFQVLIGGLNVYNSVGDYYTAQGVTRLFEESSLLMRRLKNGYLKGERGHPKQGGLSNKDYINRLLEIDDGNVMCHYRSLWLDTELGKRNPKLGNPNLIGIYGEACGSGPHGEAFNRSMENPSENVAFSVRGFTNDQYVKGTNVRELINIITWDVVIEPGIGTSNKFDAISLEEFKYESLANKYFSLESLKEVANSKSGISTESKDIVTDVIQSFEASKYTPDKPAYLKW